MRIIKLKLLKYSEFVMLLFIYFLLILNYFIFNDSLAAILSAFFGITYTILAGKGNPICYLFGLSGSSFYIYLALNNSIWGNLLLYAAYYVPMQILGFFRWKKNLKTNKYEIIKTSLDRKTFTKIGITSLLAIIITSIILVIFDDKHPYIDSITTILSLSGMYLTVKRCIEQWIFWMVVNGLSAIMWINIALSGEKVYSTVIMWSVYFILAIYFYFIWKKDLSNNQ